MLPLDHVAIWCQDLFRTTFRLSQESGIGNRDGGFLPGLGLGQKVMPLGKDAYLEIESIVDYTRVLDPTEPIRQFMRQTRDGDCFAGWSLRSDSLDVIEVFAKHRGVHLAQGVPGGKVRMDGYTKTSVHAPSTYETWLSGMPNIYYVPDLQHHSSRLPVDAGTGRTQPTGVLALEIGGSENDLATWFGDICSPGNLPIELSYNGGPPGLYALQVGTQDGVHEIRLKPIAH